MSKLHRQPPNPDRQVEARAAYYGRWHGEDFYPSYTHAARYFILQALQLENVIKQVTAHPEAFLAYTPERVEAFRRQVASHYANAYRAAAEVGEPQGQMPIALERHIGAVALDIAS